MLSRFMAKGASGQKDKQGKKKVFLVGRANTSALSTPRTVGSSTSPSSKSRWRIWRFRERPKALTLPLEPKLETGETDTCVPRAVVKGKDRAFGVQIAYDPGEAATVDIVCIHGLNTDGFRSWTAQDNQGHVSWFPDYLHDKFPTARLITYGYDGAMFNASPLSQHTIPDIAEGLIVRLTLTRMNTNTDNRRIIFIVHGVGGIVLKKALIISSLANKSHNQNHLSFLESTIGIIFMGTPHQGADCALLQAMRPPMYTHLKGETSENADDLGRDSTFLQAIASEYTAICSRILTVYMYEMQASQLPWGAVSIIVPKSSAVVSSHQDAWVLGRETNHFGLSQFNWNDLDITSILLTTMMMKAACNRLAPGSTEAMRPNSEVLSHEGVHTQGSQSLVNVTADIHLRCPRQHMSPWTVFTWHLLKKRIGYPLWIPAPGGNTPTEYQGVGVQIGDIGLLNKGSFNFLFNVCKTADDPVNRGNVPDGFVSFSMTDRDVEKHCDLHAKNSQYLSSEELMYQRFIIDGSNNISGLPPGVKEGFHYRTTMDEGALLVLPDGADSYELGPLQRMQKYVQENSRIWFAHVDAVGYANPDLYLVTGCDKTSSWGVASFRSSSNKAPPDFHFCSREVPRETIDYLWHCLSPVNARASGGNSVKNQCVFLRGFNISRRCPGPALEETMHQVALMDGTPEDGYYEDLGRSIEYQQRKGWPLRLAPSLAQNPVSSTTDSNFSHIVKNLSADPVNIRSLALQSEVLHPGHILNHMLLTAAGDNADLVVTHDNTWRGFSSPILYSILSDTLREAVTNHIIHGSELRIRQGIVSLEPVITGLQPRCLTDVMRCLLDTNPLSDDEENSQKSASFDFGPWYLRSSPPVPLTQTPSLRSEWSGCSALGSMLQGQGRGHSHSQTGGNERELARTGRISSGGQHFPSFPPLSMTSQGCEEQYTSTLKNTPALPPATDDKRMRVKALLIGIEYGGELHGPREDIEAAKRAIQAISGNGPDIRLMGDWLEQDDSMYPSYANIWKQLQEFVSSEEDNVQYFVWYAGHNGQIQRGLDPTEDDWKDEFIVPADAHPPGQWDQNIIFDDELSSFLVEKLRHAKSLKKVSLLAIFDSCNSGTLLDLPHHRCNKAYNCPTCLRRTSRKVRELKLKRRQSTGRAFRLSAMARLLSATSSAAASIPSIPVYSGFRHKDMPRVISISATRDREPVVRMGDHCSMSKAIASYLETSPNPTLRELMRHIRNCSKTNLKLRNKEWQVYYDTTDPSNWKKRPKASKKFSNPAISSIAPLHMESQLFPHGT